LLAAWLGGEFDAYWCLCALLWCGERTGWRGQVYMLAEAGYFWAGAARADTVCRAWAWPLGRSWRLAPSAIVAVGRGPMLCDPWVSAEGVRAKLAFVGSTRTQKADWAAIAVQSSRWTEEDVPCHAKV
jgi:hypothetical protein